MINENIYLVFTTQIGFVKPKKNNIISLRLEFKKENKKEKNKGNALSKKSDQENNQEKKF